MLARLITAVRNPSSIGDRAVNASLWSMVSLGFQYPLRLVGNLIMTRLLAPEAFGLMAIIATLHVGLMLLSDIGITQSVMRSQRAEDPRFLRVAWTVQILRNLVVVAGLLLLGLVIYLFGPELAGADTVYTDPLLPLLIWASSLALLLKGFESTNVLLARRRMQLSRVTVIEVVLQATQLVVMVSIGLLTGSVWALIAGMLAGHMIGVVLSHTIMPGPRMALCWDREQTTEMWAFGKWVILGSVGGFFMAQGDRLVLSALMDKTLFGLYAIAVIWIDIGMLLIGRVIGSFSISAFAMAAEKTGSNPERLLLKTFLLLSWATLPIFLVFFLLGDKLIAFLYTPEYHAAGALITVLSFRLLAAAHILLRDYIVYLGDTRFMAAWQSFGGLMGTIPVYMAAIWFDYSYAIATFAVAAIPSAIFYMAYRDNPIRRILPQYVLANVVIVAACFSYVIWAHPV